jgi:hypothetical protein
MTEYTLGQEGAVGAPMTEYTLGQEGAEEFERARLALLEEVSLSASQTPARRLTSVPAASRSAPG